MAKLTDDEEITRKSYDDHAKLWANTHSAIDFYPEERKIFTELLPEGKVLEIGSGAGWDSAKLRELGYDYVGTDVSAGLIEQARLRNPEVNFEIVSVYDLDYETAFDGFWCAAVLLHIPRERIAEALSGIRRNIREGGIGFISVKEGDGGGVEKRVEHDGDGRLFVYWQDEAFSEVLKKNGFKIVHRGYRPMNERAKWLTYHVQAV